MLTIRTIHGTGKNLRTFLFVSDIVKAFDLVLHEGVTGELYNIAGKSEISVYEVAKTIWRMMGKEGSVDDHIVYVRDREFNDYRYAIDDSKLRAMGWNADTSFEEGMKETVEWYLNHPNQWKAIDSALEAHPTLAKSSGFSI